MKFYRIIHSDVADDGKAFFGTLKEAKDEAQEIADYNDEAVEVSRVEARTNRDGIIALANGRGWCVSDEKVFTAKPRQTKFKPRVDADDLCANCGGLLEDHTEGANFCPRKGPRD